MPVANLAAMNYPSSLNISLNPDALLSNTQSLFVMYANATPTIQAIIFDIAASIPMYWLSNMYVPTFNTVVNTPNIKY